jgi:peptide/nickel transport system permease protein
VSLDARDPTTSLGELPDPGRRLATERPERGDANRSASPLLRALTLLARDRVAMLALGFLVLMGAVGVLSLWWTPHDPNFQDIPRAYEAPSGDYWLGTDDLGRDMTSRLMVGARVSLRVGFQVVAMALLIAVPVGLLSGYKSGWVDNVIMRVMDALSSVPALVLAIAIAGVLGPGLRNAMIAITIVLIPSFARLVRAQALAVTTEPFVEASRSAGSGTIRILFTRIFPGVLSPLIVQASLALGAALLADAALSFLGLGVQPPEPSWGEMLRRAYDKILLQRWTIFVPGVAIALSVLAFNSVGDGLRDALGVGARKRWRRRVRLGLTTVSPGSPTSAAAATPSPAPAAADGSVTAAGSVTATGPVTVAPSSDRQADVLLSVEDLRVAFDTDRGAVTVVDGVTFDVRRGEMLALVGESGSGKTVTSLSVMRLLPSPPGRVTGGRIVFEGRDLLGLSLADMRRVRGAEIAMIFQNPMTCLDPSYTVGNSVGEALRAHRSMSRAAVRARAVELLDLVGIPDPRSRLDDYPHQFSGGMRQRVMIAMSLASEPKLLIADEPTTALDVTVQAQILDLLQRLRSELGMSVVLVTHDLGVVADACHRVAVMYAGQIVEQAPVHELFARPLHPYTEGLLGAMPQTGRVGQPLDTIPGVVPQPWEMPVGCRFHPRCAYAVAACAEAPVPMERAGAGREVRCIRSEELTLRGTS